MDYCSLLSLPRYETLCLKHQVKGLVGTRIGLEDQGRLLGELIFVAQNSAGLAEISSLISRVAAHKHNIQKVKYTDSDASLGQWVYKTMLPEDFNVIGANVEIIISPQTPELAEHITENQCNKHLLARLIGAKRISSPMTKENQIYLETISFGDNADTSLFAKRLESLHLNLPDWEKGDNRISGHKMKELFAAAKATQTIPSVRANTARLIHATSPVSVLAKEKMPNVHFGIDLFAEASALLQQKLAANPQLNAAKYTDYLEREISILKKIGGAGYYQTIIAFSNDLQERNHPSLNADELAIIRIRGSATASLILNLFGVTSALNDPVEQGLLIERFITSSRVEYPDVDIDIPKDQRNLFVQFMESHFGKNTVVSFVNQKQKAGFRALLGKVVSLYPEDSVNLSRKYLNDLDQQIREEIEAYDSQDMHLSNVVAKSRILAQERQRHPALNQAVIRAKDYSEWTTTVTTHPSGMIFSPTRAFKLPLVVNAAGGKVLESTKPSELGFVKFDILSSNNVKFLREAAKLLKIRQGINHLTPTHLNASFFQFLTNNTSFLNQMGGSSMRRTLQRVQPRNIEDLLLSMALPRPILTKEDREIFYLRRSGQMRLPDTAMYQDQRVVDILAPTCGFVLFDEQILELCFKVAGMTEAQADKLRTSIKKNKIEDFHAMKDAFISGVIENGGHETMGHEIYQVFAKSVGRYAFPKAHALSYATIAIEQAWLKLNHPDVALNAIVNSFKLSTQPKKGENATRFDRLLNEYRKRGIEVVSPSISKSMRNEYQLVRQSGRQVIYAPLAPIFKNTQGSFGNIMLDIVDKMSEKMLFSQITLKSFIDMAVPEFRRVLREEYQETNLYDVNASCKHLVNRLIYFGAFDEVGFTKQTPVSSNRKDARSALLGMSQMYMEEVMSDFPTGKFNDVEIHIEGIDLYEAEKKIFKTSFFAQNLGVALETKQVCRHKEPPQPIQYSS
ncbi:hypothetical protein EA58_13860 [Photobacterium galatheae]|uniref:Uncharacterized protein n=2 Tax=Photobacterium galatheae TaxID=1654360 RepID=A0A066RP01_9GAMM|nr:hypothetical protein EA58_13860 [Photobacterium galatheae]